MEMAPSAQRRRRSAQQSTPRLTLLLPLLLLLLLLLSIAGPARGDDGAAAQPLQTQLLTAQPNCALKNAEGGALPAGIPPIVEADGGAAATPGGCSVVLPQLARGETHVYEFDVAPGSEMSLLMVMRTRGGSVAM